MNKVCLIGRACKDIQSRTLPTGSVTADFTLAVDRRKRDDGADFIDCTAWGKTAELLATYVGKGDMIGVVGRITTGHYTNRDGIEVYTTKVTIEEVKFLGRNRGNNTEAAASNATTETGAEEFTEVNDDELPF